MPSADAAKNIGVGPCRGETYGEILEAMAKVAPSQPNESMARIAPRRNGNISLGISLDPSFRVKFPKMVLWTRFRFIPAQVVGRQ